MKLVHAGVEVLGCDAPRCDASVGLALAELNGWMTYGSDGALCPDHGKNLRALQPVRVVEADASLDVEVTIHVLEEGIERSISDLAEKLRAAGPSPDELAALHLLVDRVFGPGRRYYGPLDEDRDPRKFHEELAHELVDGCFYGVADLLRLARLLRRS